MQPCAEYYTTQVATISAPSEITQGQGSSFILNHFMLFYCFCFIADATFGITNQVSGDCYTSNFQLTVDGSASTLTGSSTTTNINFATAGTHTVKIAFSYNDNPTAFVIFKEISLKWVKISLILRFIREQSIDVCAIKKPSEPTSGKSPADGTIVGTSTTLNWDQYSPSSGDVCSKTCVMYVKKKIYSC